ncbi:MAG: peptide-methionine (S)-S-oxide reductase MsrA [Pseudomonadales bacterium]|nr:peptide-methionine (S)-S-oxide reductase MsrA [Pseudomonadales bacterium]
MNSVTSRSAILRFISIILLLTAAKTVTADTEEAVFAGGCFWCVEALYQEIPGVTDVVSGFTGGKLPNPKYSGNHKGHYEAVKVTYDNTIVTYQDLLDLYWVNIDPFDDRGQFCDKGPSYLSAIFVADESQQQLAEASKARVMEQFPAEQVVTRILPASRFWPVEEYHQDYYKKNPIRYRFYRTGCGRDARLADIWGDAVTKH